MLLEEWDMDEALKDARAEGREEGREELKRELICALKGVLAPEVIAEKFAVSIAYVQEIFSESE